MKENEFNRQYDRARFDRLQHLLDQVCCSEYFRRLPAEALWEALVERIEDHVNIEETEIRCILDIIADRLGALEEKEGKDR